MKITSRQHIKCSWCNFHMNQMDEVDHDPSDHYCHYSCCNPQCPVQPNMTIPRGVIEGEEPFDREAWADTRRDTIEEEYGPTAYGLGVAALVVIFLVAAVALLAKTGAAPHWLSF